MKKNHLPVTKSKFLLFWLVIILLIFSFAWQDTILFTDEIIYEDIAYHMAATGDWLTPKLEGKIWLERPPLYFWLTAAIFKFAPLAPLSRRIVTLILAVGTVILTYRLAAYFYNRKTALFSALSLTFTPLFLYFTKTANLDIPNAFFILLTIFAYLKAKQNPRWLLLSALSQGLGFLNRSFLSLTPLAVIALDQLFFVKKRFSFFAFLNFLFIILLITLPWHIYIFSRHPALFLDRYLFFNLKDHLLLQTPGHEPLTAIDFLAKTLVLYNPLILALPLSLLLNRKWLRPPPLLLALITIPLFTLTLSQTRHEWYALQLLPPLSILSGRALNDLAAYFSSKSSPAWELAKIFALSLVFSLPWGVFKSINQETKSVAALREFINITPASTPLYNLDYAFTPQSTLFNPRETFVIASATLGFLDKPIYLYTHNHRQLELVRQQLNHCCTFKSVVSYQDAQVIEIKPNSL